jgi:hypothetical protein
MILMSILTVYILVLKNKKMEEANTNNGIGSCGKNAHETRSLA